MKLIDLENMAVDYDPMDALLSALHDTRRRIAALEAELDAVKAGNEKKDQMIERMSFTLSQFIPES